jgi:hypothetical protein
MAYHTLPMISIVADRGLVDKVLEKFDRNIAKCEEWFNAEIKGLNYQTPYDLCRTGKQTEVYAFLNSAE